MKKDLLHTPEGVRDIYNGECARKIVLQNRLHDVCALYGYNDIQTPSFEFFDVFNKERGSVPSTEMFKFFDRYGNTLVLRPDMTPAIARTAAKYFEDDNRPLKLCYVGNTFVNVSKYYQGKLKESTAVGAELIGDDSIDADLEIISMVIDCMKNAGLEEFQISIGNVDFFQSLIEESEIDDETEERLRELINNRNFFGADELLEEADAKPVSRKAFSALSEMVGGVEILEEAKKVAPSKKAMKAIRRLEKIYAILSVYKMEQYITFDLSMSGIYGYYTGIIFRGYTFGTGDAIVKGGRYDHLVEKFGKEEPAIGFAIVVDELMSALSRQKIQISSGEKSSLILYDKERLKDAIQLAMEFRGKDKNTQILQKASDKSLEFYVDYGKRSLAGSMLYLRSKGDVQMVNLMTGEEKIVG